MSKFDQEDIIGKLQGEKSTCQTEPHEGTNGREPAELAGSAANANDGGAKPNDADGMSTDETELHEKAADREPIELAGAPTDANCVANPDDADHMSIDKIEPHQHQTGQAPAEVPADGIAGLHAPQMGDEKPMEFAGGETINADDGSDADKSELHEYQRDQEPTELSDSLAELIKYFDQPFGAGDGVIPDQTELQEGPRGRELAELAGSPVDANDGGTKPNDTDGMSTDETEVAGPIPAELTASPNNADGMSTGGTELHEKAADREPIELAGPVTADADNGAELREPHMDGGRWRGLKPSWSSPTKSTSARPYQRNRSGWSRFRTESGMLTPQPAWSQMSAAA